jgi:hypothetical protein
MEPRQRIALALALVAPWAVGAALVPFRDEVARTNAALVLVVVVVAVAALGNRAAGAVAAVSAGACFDFLLTRPFQSFSISARDDVVTALLLVVVGLSVSELAVRGQLQRARSVRSQGYLDGIREALEAVADDAPADVLVERVGTRLVAILELAGCRFDPGPAPAGPHPRLRPDGEVEVDGAVCDIRHFGLPVDRAIELPVGRGPAQAGRFWLHARPDARPGQAERLVAVALAERAATALAASRSGRR